MQNQTDRWDTLKTSLKEGHTWPHDYTFKFIVPQDQVETVQELLPELDLKIRTSKGGRYVSLTAIFRAASPDEIIERYRRLSPVENLISL